MTVSLYPQPSLQDFAGSTTYSRSRLIDLSYAQSVPDELIIKIAKLTPDLHALRLPQTISEIGTRALGNFCPDLSTVRTNVSPGESCEWHLVAAAMNGPLGVSLVKHLVANHLDKLSPISILAAKKIAAYQQDKEIVKALEHLNPPRKECSTIMDVKILLSSSTNPSGYRPLGDFPERYKWGTLTAADAECLYHAIVAGKTRLVINEPAIYPLIQTILTTPSGRWLLYSCANSSLPVHIKTGATSYFQPFDDCVVISVSLTPACLLTLEEDGSIVEFAAPPDSTLFHEALHFFHFHVNSNLMSELIQMETYDKNYTRLEEQFTIAGVDDDYKDLFEIPFCQNTYHYERGYLPRYGHNIREYLSIPLNKIKEAHQLPVKIGWMTEWTLSKRINKYNFMKVAAHCPNLSKLKITYCPDMTDEWLGLIAFYFKKLQLLNLESCGQISELGLMHLQRLEKLYLPPHENISGALVPAKVYYSIPSISNVFVHVKKQKLNNS